MLKTIRFMVIGLVLVVAGSILVAAPGDLDKTFNSDGYVTTNLGIVWSDPAEVVLDSQGRIVVAGAAMGRPVVLRYNPDGLLDTTFGTDGILLDTLEFPDAGIGMLAKALTIDANGKILIAGNAQYDGAGYNRMVIVRYNEDGSRDNSFDGDGVWISDIGDDPRSIALDTQGRIVTAGPSFTSITDGYITRNLPDGTPDTTFGINGRVITVNQIGTTLLLAEADSIIVAGFRYLDESFENSDFILTKFDPVGDLDTSFGTNGITLTDFDGHTDRPSAMSRDADGNLVVAGYTGDATYVNEPVGHIDVALARYTPAGILDSNFGNGGKVRTDFENRADYAADVVLLPDNRLLIVGTSHNPSYGGSSMLARYNPDGSLDTTFGIGGWRVDGVKDTFVSFSAGVLTADQKVIALGSTLSGDYLLARYEMTGSPRTELLINGGFEDAGATNKLPANWSGTNLTKEVRKCNKPSANKFVAFTGNCAMRFVGGNKEKSVLSQIIPGTALNIGDRLSLSAWAKSSPDNYNNVAVLATVIYASGSQAKIVVTLHSTRNDYEQFVAPVYKVTDPVNQIKVDIRSFAYQGKLLIDRVSLSKIAGSSPAVAIPAPVIPLP